jgi:hypothetical protein
MRIVCSALLVAGAALFGSSGTIAAPVNGGAIKAAADGIGINESVHCRPFRHWHRYGGYSRGCRPGIVIYNDRPRLRLRYGVRSRDYDTRVRTGVTIRSEERSTIRSGTTFRSGGGGGGSATIRSGGGDGAPRVTSGGQNQGAAGTAGGGGRQINTAPTSQGAPVARGQGRGQGQGRGEGGGAQQKQ